MTHFNKVALGSHWSSLVVKLSALPEGTQIKTYDLITNGLLQQKQSHLSFITTIVWSF